ncbi:MAG TPA: SRPBCC family protein [Acidimicrobiia bacterium]|jgi:carbon monoxide dehydrogenase subunit G
MDVSQYHHSGSISIDRPPADVYAIVSDVTRTGELSPVCQSCAWDDTAQAGRAGAWFTGHNVVGDVSWDTHCQVSVAEPGREFTFVNHGPNGDAELVRWGYTFEPDGAGTTATESWQVLAEYPTFVQGGNPDMDVTPRIEGMAQMAREGIKDTLASLKRVAEA